MADKSNFTPDEWVLVTQGPMLAGMAVTLADPGGIWGTLKEGLASGTALLEAKNDAGAGALAKAVVAEIETSEGRSALRERMKAELGGKKPPEMKQAVMTELNRLGALLNAKAPQDAAAFKAWLQHVAEKVANASTEGGFLGFGGVRVSDAEKATLAEIATALNGRGAPAAA